MAPPSNSVVTCKAVWEMHHRRSLDLPLEYHDNRSRVKGEPS